MANLAREQTEKAPSRIAAAQENDLLELLPEEVRPMAKRYVHFLVGIAELEATRALSRLRSAHNATNLVTVKEAAVCLHVSLSMVRNLLRQGELEEVKTGRSVRIVPASLEAYIERNKYRHANQ
jgi:excisionase family DNA binding protein